MLQSFKLYEFMASFTSIFYVITVAQILRTLHCELDWAVCMSGFVSLFNLYFSRMMFENLNDFKEKKT